MGRGRTTESALTVYGVNAVLEVLRSGAEIERVLVGAGPRRDEILAAARARGVRAASVDRDELTRTAQGPHHQGVIAVIPAFAYAELEDILAAPGNGLLLLDGLQDPRNLGAILRTARAAGIRGVILPKDRSVGVTSVVVSASAGLLFGLPIARVTNLVRSMEAVKAAGFWTVGLAAGGQNVFAFDAPAQVALVLGGEGEGLRPLVRQHCDFEVGIPMAPGVESLNASVAAGIALYALVGPMPRSVGAIPIR